MPKLTLYSVYSPRLKGLLKHPATVQRGDGLPVLFTYEETAEQASSCLIEPGPVVQVSLEWSLAEPIIEEEEDEQQARKAERRLGAPAGSLHTTRQIQRDAEAAAEKLVSQATEQMIAEAEEPRRVGRLGLSAGKKSVHKPPVPR